MLGDLGDAYSRIIVLMENKGTLLRHVPESIQLSSKNKGSMLSKVINCRSTIQYMYSPDRTDQVGLHAITKQKVDTLYQFLFPSLLPCNNNATT
jgi:hypothetical protein